ncbi:MAG: twin-arginine translocation signal domain-containing protein [Gaiellaceae bacterium]
MSEVERLQTSPDDLQYLDNVLEDTGTPRRTRRSLLKHAAVGAAAVGVFGPASSALAGISKSGDDANTVVTTAVTAEALAVTVLTAAVKTSPGTKAAPFIPVLKSANYTEFRHYEVLSGLGAKPLTTKFWIPNAALGAKNINLFKTIELAETLFVNAYLIGITTFARAKKDSLARYAGEILGTEAEHRVLARYAETVINGLKHVPNNVGFETYRYTSMAAIVAQLEKAGFGFGKQSSAPGQFVDFPGNPLKTGTGSSVLAPAPA